MTIIFYLLISILGFLFGYLAARLARMIRHKVRYELSIYKYLRKEVIDLDNYYRNGGN